MPDSDWWDKVAKSRDGVKSVELDRKERQRIVIALEKWSAYLKSQRATDPKFDELAEKIRRLD